MRKFAALLVVSVAIMIVPAIAGDNGAVLRSKLERQRAVSSDPANTSSKRWKDVPGYTVVVCARRAISAHAFVNVTGAPVRFRFTLDSGAIFRPNAGRFDPRDGTRSFMLMGVQKAETFEGTDGHAVTLQWQSPTGDNVSLGRAIMNVLYQKGSCP